MTEYKTSSLYEASFLACKGYQFLSKEKHNHKTILIYKNSENLQEAVIDFYRGGTVKAKEFCDWYRTIKDYVFSE